MNLVQTRQTIERAFFHNIPILLWGEAGVGKSSIVQQLADDEGVELLDLRLSQIESVDVRGALDIAFRDAIDRKVTEWVPPGFFPFDEDSCGILFLDEIPQADLSTQKACYQLIQDRKVGDYTLPVGWRIVGAGNPGEDRITQALGNRFMHVTVEPSVLDWSVWAKKNGISDDIIGFLMSRPELLLCPPTDQDDYAYPSPRMWEHANRIHLVDRGLSIYTEAMEGTVGKGAVIEFLAYVNMLAKLPDVDELAANPGKYDFNDSPSKVAALCMMISSQATNKNIDNLMDWVLNTNKEFQVLTITMINGANNGIMGTRKITDWCLKNRGIF
jgi:hypothetical protein